MKRLPQLFRARRIGAGVSATALIAFGLLMPMYHADAQGTPVQSPVQVGPNPMPNPIPAGTTPIPPTTGVPYTDPVPPQMWLWNTSTPTLPTIRLQSAPVAPYLPPGGALWGLADGNNRLSSLGFNSGAGPDVVFKADGDVADLIITNLGKREGSIRFATTIMTPPPNSFYIEKERLTIANDGSATFTPDSGGGVHVNGNISCTGSLEVGGDAGLAGQMLISQGVGMAPAWADNTAWLTTGNSNTDATNFLGTTIAQPLIMKTNNQEHMRITAGGDVGIGQSSPNAKLHIVDNDVALILEGTDPNAASSPSILFKETGHDDYWALIKRGSQWPAAGQGDRLLFSFKDVTTTPTYSETWHPSLEMRPNGDVHIFSNTGIGTQPSSNVRLHVKGGPVVIGDEHQAASGRDDYRLAVDGLIVAKEFFVTITDWAWPDFVFADEYNLMPLNEVERNIRENRHLPGIPSAAEVKENGVNVVEMQTKLLQKIEELTLYVIEQEKKINTLEAQITGGK